MPSLFAPKRFLKFSFAPGFSRSSRKPREFNKTETTSARWAILASILFIFLFLMLGRLIDLQVIGGSYYKSLSEGNRIRRIPIKAPRGEILDNAGQPLARNTPVYKLATFTPSGVVERTDPITREEALHIQTANLESATRLLIDSGRQYPLKEAAAHLVGFVNETSEGEVGHEPDCSGIVPEIGISREYELGDLIGRMGIEQQYDCILRGVNGEELIEVDARGRLSRKLGRREPIAGRDIRLSIDNALQQAAYDALIAAPDEKGIGPRRDKGEIVKGAVVVQEPSSGKVLALVSTPSYDPGQFKEKYAEYAKDPNLPFFDRAIGAAFHPGSTFKIATSVAGLQEGTLNADYKYTDIGFVEAGGIRFRNWYFVRYGKGEGEINLVRAITRSTDTFFYIAGEQVGIEKLAFWAGALGLGKKSGIDLPNETEGLMPTPEWKLKAKGERWFLGNTYNAAIGQGDVLTSPIQINTMVSAIANNGTLCAPSVLDDRVDTCYNLGLKNETLQLVEEGMKGACSPGGTAGIFFSFSPQVACKTGTAEVGNDKTHAWFTAYAPLDSPQVAITAVVEEGGEGSVVAAPVVKKIMSKYFGK